MEERSCTNESHDHASTSQREKKLASFAIHQQDSGNGYKEVHNRECNVAPVSLYIGEAALQKDIGVVTDDAVNSRQLVACENDASQQKWNHILAAHKRPRNITSNCQI